MFQEKLSKYRYLIAFFGAWFFCVDAPILMAAPQIVDVSYRDTGGVINVDAIYVTYSEDIIQNEFEVNDWRILPGDNNDLSISDVIDGNVVNGNQLVLTVDWANEVTGETASEPMLEYEAANETEGSITNGVEPAPDYVATAINDRAAPQMIAVESIDADFDGRVDALEIQFSENMRDTDFSVAALADWAVSSDEFLTYDLFSGFETVVSVIAGDDLVDDGYVRLTFEPVNVTGTGLVSFRYQGDGENNIYDQTGVNALADIAVTVATDSAGPAILSAAVIDQTTVRAVFSESVAADSVDWSDFIFQSFTSVGANANASLVDSNDGDNVLLLTLDAPVNDDESGQIRLSDLVVITDGTIESRQTAWIDVVPLVLPDTVPPFVQSVAYSNNPANSDNDTRITVVMSESLASGTAPSISIDQAGIVDIDQIIMTDSGDSVTYFYDYNVHSAAGNAYVDGAAYIGISGARDAADNEMAVITTASHTYSFVIRNISNGGGGPPPDSVPPKVISFVINGNDQRTDDREVRLQIKAIDARYMAIANTADFADASWENYRQETKWRLTDDEGVATVYIKFKDAAGNVSAVATDTIVYQKNNRNDDKKERADEDEKKEKEKKPKTGSVKGIKVLSERYSADKTFLDFQKIYKRKADLNNRFDEIMIFLMSNVEPLLYRDLRKEQNAIKTFGAVFARLPRLASDWHIIHAIAYSGAKR